MRVWVWRGWGGCAGGRSVWRRERPGLRLTTRAPLQCRALCYSAVPGIVALAPRSCLPPPFPLHLPPFSPPQGDPKTGANDPIYFLHQAFIDKTYADWQAKHNAADYGGQHRDRNVAASDTLPPFGVQVSATFSLPCVSYTGGPTSRSARSARGRRARSRSDAVRVVASKLSRRQRAAAAWANKGGLPASTRDKGLAVGKEVTISAAQKGII